MECLSNGRFACTIVSIWGMHRFTTATVVNRGRGNCCQQQSCLVKLCTCVLPATFNYKTTHHILHNFFVGIGVLAMMLLRVEPPLLLPSPTVLSRGRPPFSPLPDQAQCQQRPVSNSNKQDQCDSVWSATRRNILRGLGDHNTTWMQISTNSDPL